MNLFCLQFIFAGVIFCVMTTVYCGEETKKSADVADKKQEKRGIYGEGNHGWDEGWDGGHGWDEDHHHVHHHHEKTIVNVKKVRRRK